MDVSVERAASRPLTRHRSKGSSSADSVSRRCQVSQRVVSGVRSNTRCYAASVSRASTPRPGAGRFGDTHARRLPNPSRSIGAQSEHSR